MHNCFLHELFSAIWWLLHESVVSLTQVGHSEAFLEPRDVSMKKSPFWHGPPQPHSGLSLSFLQSYRSLVFHILLLLCFLASVSLSLPLKRFDSELFSLLGCLAAKYSTVFILPFFQMLCFFLVLLVSLQLSEDSAHSKTRKVTAAYRPDASHFKMAYFYLHWLFDSFSFMHLQKDLNSSLTHNHAYVCVSMTPGVSVNVPCVSEIMRKFSSLFWEYTLHKLLLKQL